MANIARIEVRSQLQPQLLLCTGHTSKSVLSVDYDRTDLTDLTAAAVYVSVV